MSNIKDNNIQDHDITTEAADVFTDPVSYLASFGINSELVTTDELPLAA